ncbi:MAG TPA: ParB/RepB/Spo0J family partition protein [Longimicrobiales bacterium]|nr:ParB/RepB/Spo0J family partition protein [Longimicrobiales bacterium]
MSKRDRLGKGLGALLGEYLPEDAAAENSVRNIPLAAIVPNPFQPRREFAEEELADLTASIRENGLLQPIIVRPAPAGRDRFELVAGERRWRACLRLGWKDIPATVRSVDDRTLLVLALVENMQRTELSPIEEAEALKRLSGDFSLSQQQIAELVGKDRSTVANLLRLLQLPAAVRGLVADGRLSAGHARALLSLEDDPRMGTLAEQAVAEGWSVRETEERVGRLRGTPRRARPRGPRARDVNERVLEEELQRVLGTEVRIHAGRAMRGRIEIPFFGAEDFERIFELLAGQSATDVVS